MLGHRVAEVALRVEARRLDDRDSGLEVEAADEEDVVDVDDAEHHDHRQQHFDETFYHSHFWTFLVHQ